MKSLLLHTCCAPCSAAILEWLLQNDIQPIIYYENSNIAPQAEYERRLNECKVYAEQLGLTMVIPPYDHAAWLQYVQGLEQEPERGKRCQRCFEFRMNRSAEAAAAMGIPLFATTLASSRWKDLAQIAQAGIAAAANHPSVDFWDRNWRKGGLQQRRNELLKENGFYNQTFCGCEFSQKK